MGIGTHWIVGRRDRHGVYATPLNARAYCHRHSGAPTAVLVDASEGTKNMRYEKRGERALVPGGDDGRGYSQADEAARRGGQRAVERHDVSALIFSQGLSSFSASRRRMVSDEIESCLSAAPSGQREGPTSSTVDRSAVPSTPSR